MCTQLSVAVIGAGGKMGCRIVDHLKAHPDFSLSCVETSEAGQRQLAARGLESILLPDAVRNADVVVLALPDRLIGSIARSLVGDLRSGCLVVLLDPAAAFAGELPERPDIGYFVSHPCHPSVFDHFDTEDERNDFFGGTHARQAIVCALMQGPEEAFVLGERIATEIYAPVTRAHRVTVEQMALLEPAMAETVGIALIRTLRDALEEVVARGVPRQAAEDFLYGHIRVPLGIAFERVSFPFSDGAKLIADYGREVLLQKGWERVFERENVLAQCRAITGGSAPAPVAG